MAEDGLQPLLPEAEFAPTIRGLVQGEKLFNRYTLTRILGRGGMGLVWLAFDEDLGEEIALKFLPETVHLDATALKELKRETRHSRKLAHPNIVKVYDFVSDGLAAAISMEFVDGETLSGLRGQQPELFLEVAQIEGWTAQLLNALVYAHEEARIVHRDLKPANTMVDQSGRVKVTDFGIASSISENLTRVTRQQTSSGTLVYMSPQQATGNPPSVQDDIYALGATLFELLTSKPPFYRGDILSQLWEAIPPSMTERRAELKLAGEPIPEHWEQAVAACLHKDAAQRPQTIPDVARLLGFDVSGAEPDSTAVLEENSPLPGLSAVKDHRKRRLVGLGVAGLLIVLAALGYYYTAVIPAERARQARIDQEQAAAESQKQAAAAKVLADAQRKIDEEKAALVKAQRDAADQAAAEKKTQEIAAAAAAEKERTDEASRRAAQAKLDAEKLAADQAAADKAHADEAARIAAAAAASAAAKAAPVNPVAPPSPAGGNPPAATTLVNSQGIKFVPAGTDGVLFSVWDVRVKDYADFIHDTGQNWNKPDFAQTDNDPVVKVSWNDANAYCAWLTKNERDLGKIASNQAYRLPTDAEWSAAVGLHEPDKGTPAEKSDKIANVFPWGPEKIPPSGAGDLAGEEIRNVDVGYSFIIGFKDDFHQTAPVGGFTPNAFGLYDMAGNTRQWCQNKMADYSDDRVVRGSSWMDSVTANLLSSHRCPTDPGLHTDTIGFRIVLAVDTHAASKETPGLIPIAPSSVSVDPDANGSVNPQTVGFVYLDATSTMKPCRKGFQGGSNAPQDTDDPNDIIIRRPVYFDEKDGNSLHFSVNSTQTMTKLTYNGFGFCDLVIKVLDPRGKEVASAGPFNYGSVTKTVEIAIPNLSSFELVITNSNSPWLLINNIRFQGISSTLEP